jgi:SAM-dependent methyltransferase
MNMGQSPEPPDSNTAFPGSASDAKLKELGYDLVGEYRLAIGFAGLGRDDQVLDVATGSGRMAYALARAGCRVVSGDISQVVVEETRGRVGALTHGAVDFRVMDAGHLGVPDAIVPCIVSANTIHHLAEPERVLEEWTRALADDGRLVIVEFHEHMRHEQGRISTQSLCEFLRARFGEVEHHRLPLNDVWVARRKRQEPARTLGSVHGQCFACGPANPSGLGLRFAADGAKGVLARCTLEGKYQGYEGVVQGGIVSLLLDSAMTNCLFQLGIQAVTARLSVRFSRPVPTAAPLVVRASMMEGARPRRRGRAVYTLRAVVEHEGIERASATGTFVSLAPVGRSSR